MRIWVDADACPKVIKEILFRAAQRAQISLILVANHHFPTPSSPLISTVRVAGGFDVADRHIADNVVAGDLVVTADIPLAAQVIEKHALALNPRGELYTANDIQQRLSIRNFMEEVRNTGQNIGGPAPLSQADRRAFASHLDKILSRPS